MTHDLNEAETIATWDLLQDLGFQPDDEVVYSHVRPGLSFDFGNFKLAASCLVTMRFAEVVVFNGILKTPRTIGEVDFEMPRRVTCQEQCAAWIVWHLDGFAEGGVFIPVREVEWVIEGRKSKYLLPWVIDLTAYNARPQCSVQRDWLRLALKTLSGHLAKVANESPVKLSFDGEVLSIRCAEKVVVLTGEGLPWPQDFTIPAGKLLNLPKRLMHEHIGVSIWESRLTIGHWTFSGLAEETNNPSNQGNL